MDTILFYDCEGNLVDSAQVDNALDFTPTDPDPGHVYCAAGFDGDGNYIYNAVSAPDTFPECC